MSEETRKPGVAQTMTLLFDNDPTWQDLIWFVDKAKEAGVDPSDALIFEWGDDEDPTGGPIGLSFFEHPDTGQGS